VSLRVIKMDGAVLAIKEEIPVYKLFGVSMEEGLKLIKDYLWDNLFKEVMRRKEYEEIWEKELRPLAERALTGTYKIFYYFDPKQKLFVSNDASLIDGWSAVKPGVTYIEVYLDGMTIDAISAGRVTRIVDSSVLLRNQDALGVYFVAYATDILMSIVTRFDVFSARRLHHHIVSLGSDYVDALVASVKIDETVAKSYISPFRSLSYHGILFCFTCRRDTLAQLKQMSSFEPYILNVDRFKEVMEELGYKLEVVEVREEKAGVGEWIRSGLAVIRDTGVCMAFAETEYPSGMLIISSVSVPCTTIDVVIKNAKGRLTDIRPLHAGEIIERVYMGIKIEEFTDEERVKIALERYRMEEDGRWHGRVDIGRWDVHIISEDIIPDDIIETIDEYIEEKMPLDILVMLDKATHKIYVAPLYFNGSLREIEKWMERNRRLVERIYEQVMLREDAPPELIELLTSIFLFEDIKK